MGEDMYDEILYRMNGINTHKEGADFLLETIRATCRTVMYLQTEMPTRVQDEQYDKLEEAYKLLNRAFEVVESLKQDLEG